MAKLGEPAGYRPDFQYLACLRCKMSVGIENYGSSVRLSYDVGDWQQRECCCGHLDDPVACCSFVALKRAVADLTLPH